MDAGHRSLSRRAFLEKGTLALLALPAAASLAGQHRGIDRDNLRKLRSKLHGQLIAPGDPGYDTARRIWNFRFDPDPAAIVRCADPSDVARAIAFARQERVSAAVRSGGHSQAGYSGGDGGIVIDLSRMKHIRVDAAKRTVRAGPSLTVREFDTAVQAHGLVTPMGQCPGPGIGGLTLGGGWGSLAGLYGATCDNVLEAEVVTADGRVLRASASENEDLFWGICGGAGNFGAVTALQYRLYPLRQVTAGWLRYPLAQARDVLRSYRDFTTTAADQLASQIGIAKPPDGEPALSLFVFHPGDAKTAERDLKPLLSLGRPSTDTIKRMSYLDAQADVFGPSAWGVSSYMRSGQLPELTDDLLRRLVEEPPPAQASVGIGQHHGAIARRPLNANAFPLRSPGFMYVLACGWQGHAVPQEAEAWLDRMWAFAEPLTRGVNLNMLDVEPAQRTRDAFGGNYARLAQLKREYDPENFFHLDANIQPAAAAEAH